MLIAVTSSSDWGASEPVVTTDEAGWSVPPTEAPTIAAEWDTGDGLVEVAAAAWEAGGAEQATTESAWDPADAQTTSEDATGWDAPPQVAAGDATAWSPTEPQTTSEDATGWDATAQLSVGDGTAWSPTEPQTTSEETGDWGVPALIAEGLDGLWGAGGGMVLSESYAAYEAVVAILPAVGVVIAARPEMRVVRVSDGVEIPALSVTATTDIESSAWQIRGTLSGGADLVMPGAGGAVELDAVINGFTVRFKVETIDEDRTFDRHAVSIGGRSLSAELMAPYAAPRTTVYESELLAQQLAAAELEFSDWAIDWNTVDWLVPAGGWSYQGLTPLEAINKIARAAGARVHGHPSLRQLTVSPRYAVDPRQWGSAAADMVVEGERVIQLSTSWAPAPDYDRAVVMGTSGNGVLVIATRSGRAGSTPAPEVADPLICDVATGRARASEILYGAGAGALSTLRMPLPTLLNGAALITPGKLVEVRDPAGTWKGFSTSVRVAGQRRNDGTLTAYQTVGIERRFSDA